jgi:hypothetical protein
MATRDAARAESLVRATLSIADAQLRAHYVAALANRWPVESLARALDILCQRAEQAEAGHRETLLAVVDALNAEGRLELVERLRQRAAEDSLLALERLVRRPSRGSRAPASSGAPENERAGIRNASGRPLTLGERKSLARRPDRETMRKLLADPHPEVIRRCLRNPRMTEDEVVPVAAKRPGRAEVLVEVARSRWIHSPRVRLALALNPATPLEIAVRIAGLLLRHELEMVAGSPGAAGALRAVCLEHLERRPPVAEAAMDRGEVH